jgi:hypothetical protein
MVQRVRHVQPKSTVDLLDGSNVNDYHGVIKVNGWREIMSDFKTQKEEVIHRLRKLAPTSFNYSNEMNFLYTICDKIILTWNFSLLLGPQGNLAPPLCVTAFEPFKH